MKRFSLRMPDDLHAALQHSARKEYRSLHNQILIVLEEYIRQVEFKDLETILEPPPTALEIADRLMIMDGDNNEPVNLLELPAQALAVFGTRNRHFLRVFNWIPDSADSRQEFQALADAGYHIRRWG
jgi:hypothetical protein